MNVTLKIKDDHIEWAEIWESGELITEGYIIDNQMIISYYDKSNHYLTAQDTAKRKKK